MHRITPSFIGTTIATVVAAVYTFWQGEPALHLWTPFVRFTVICGPAMVLLTYSFAAYIVENQDEEAGSSSSLGKMEYTIRVISQAFLCLSLVTIGESIQSYIVLFMLFIISNSIWSLSFHKSTSKIFHYDMLNFVLCIAYACIALYIHSVAAEFERTYPAFVMDPVALETRVTELRGQQVETLNILAGVFGAMVLNLVWLLRPWWEKYRALKANGAV